MRHFAIAAAAGSCRATLHTPSESGQWPGVILFMDGPGIRPAMTEIAERLAANGFTVLLPDLFYRAGPYEPIDARRVFADTERREQHAARFMATASVANVLADLPAFLDALSRQPETLPGPFGATGYCMGGKLALCVAGHFADRFAAVASYHGGGLETDAPDSPHLLADRIRARVYVAGAIEDRFFPDEMKQRLEQALTAAGVTHTVETYPAHHGWVPTDMPAYDAAEAEHHWRTIVPLFRETLAAAV